MSDREGFGDLLKVTAILRDRALESYRRDLAEETRLKEELEQIHALRRAAHGSEETIDARRLIGADTLWQGWLTRRQAEINRNMAMARAKQAHSVAAARTAFARDKAANSVARSAENAARQRRDAREEAEIEHLARLRRLRSEE